MALKGFIKNDSYTNIKELYYNKNERKLTCSLDVFEDNQKLNKIHSWQIDFSSVQSNHQTLDGLIDSKEQAEEGKMYFISLNSTDPFFYYVQKPVEIDSITGSEIIDAKQSINRRGYLFKIENGSESFYFPSNNIYYNNIDNQFITINNSKFKKVKDLISDIDFENAFGIDKQEKQDLVALIYKAIKKLDLFKNIEDA